jgi:CBS domain-containing protein
MTLDEEKMLAVGELMSSPVLTATPETSFAEAVKTMAQNNIGNLVVLKDDAVRGILTDRAILNYVAIEKATPDTRVEDIPGQKFMPVMPNTAIIEAAKIMIHHAARLLVFKRDEHSGLDSLAGILTASDLMRGFLQTDRNPTLQTTMSGKLVTVNPTNSILYAIKRMAKRRIGSVLTSIEGHPIGLLSERDIVTKVLARNIDLEDKVGKYASQPIVTANIGIGASQAGRIMVDNKVKRLPLKKGEQLVAIVTARDIVEAYQRRM